MRLLGIETSSRRGSVALVEAGRVVVRATHERSNAHAEELGRLLDSVIADSGWSRHSLDRVAVGMGPGSFTGVRVGIAFAEGVAIGLGIELFGVTSLRAMARAVPDTTKGLRVPLLDARRGEIFAAVYRPNGSEAIAPRVITRASAIQELSSLAADEHLFVGEVGDELGAAPLFRSMLTDLPDAGFLAVTAAELPAAESIREPLYVRDAGATPQALPPSPFRND